MAVDRAAALDPADLVDAIYDIVDGKLEFGGYFKMPAPQVEAENCVAHDGSIVCRAAIFSCKPGTRAVSL